MVSESTIKANIEKRVAGNYSIWTIGVTDDLERRRIEHGNPSFWYHWDADFEQVARNVESYFLDKGMKGGTSGLGKADHVYIFTNSWMGATGSV